MVFSESPRILISGRFTLWLWESDTKKTHAYTHTHTLLRKQKTNFRILSKYRGKQGYYVNHKMPHVTFLVHMSNHCFHTNYSFSLILVFPYPRYDLRYPIRELPPLPESIRSGTKPCFLEPSHKSPNTSSNRIKSPLRCGLTEMALRSPWYVFSPVARNSCPSWPSSSFILGSLFRAWTLAWELHSLFNWTNQAVSFKQY